MRQLNMACIGYRPLNILWTLVILLLQPTNVSNSYVTIGGISNNMFQGRFKIYNNVSINEHISTCTIKDTPYSRLRCFDLCAQDVWCAGVYAVFVQGDGDGGGGGGGGDGGGGGFFSGGRGFWKCYLCMTAWIVESLVQGGGHYAAAMVRIKLIFINMYNSLKAR